MLATHEVHSTTGNCTAMKFQVADIAVSGCTALASSTGTTATKKNQSLHNLRRIVSHSDKQVTELLYVQLKDDTSKEISYIFRKKQR
jgi:hypothetical protein